MMPYNKRKNDSRLKDVRTRATARRAAELCPLNGDARLKNEEILNKLCGHTITFKSIDSVGAVEGENEARLQEMYPTEY